MRQIYKIYPDDITVSEKITSLETFLVLLFLFY
jgi:hypothetical protein